MLLFLAVGIGVLFLAHTAPFPFLLEAFSPSRSIWHMPDEPNRQGPPLVYLTYDDGPNPAATPALLDVLRETDARATFFLIDAHLNESTAPIVRRMFDEGHAVALHSDSRALMIKTPLELAVLLTGYADRIEQLAGRRPCRLFRPHAGWRSGSMYEGLAQIDHRLVGWSWGLWDWNWYRPRDADSLARRLAKRASRGDIVVMHDGHHVNPAADRRYAIEATRQLVPALRKRGFGFGRLCVPPALESSLR
ncbi:MAG TPA: polysaccharide deacetylase family protein [Vicinamibacterales bacterium]|nr:polysaccharide deacetylase family protein [Vicinamibacterales bacterium]